jgi:hypothetical protein
MGTDDHDGDAAAEVVAMGTIVAAKAGITSIGQEARVATQAAAACTSPHGGSRALLLTLSLFSCMRRRRTLGGACSCDAFPRARCRRSSRHAARLRLASQITTFGLTKKWRLLA